MRLNPIFFTGDNIEGVANYIFDYSNYITGDHNRPLYKGNPNDLLEKYIREINSLKPKVLFVYGHDTEIFLSICNQINTPFILVTHNSDLGVFEKYKSLINDKIVKWFGQNNYIQHEKVVALPIGLARKKYPHGNIHLFEQIVNKQNTKSSLYFKNFSIDTNIHERSFVDNITSNNGFVMSPPTSIENYWTKLSQSVFSVCPPGNGIDCHRIWESLYLNTIPIVKFNQAFESFQDLPILFINSWECLTFDLLENYYKSFKGFTSYNLEKLDINYWYNKIKNE